MALLGSGSSGSKGKVRTPKQLHVPNVETDPSKSGNPDQVQQRTAIATQGIMLKNENKKNRSTGIKVGGKGIKR